MELVGIVSALIALVAFIGLEYGYLRANYFLYDFLNFIGGLGLLIYAVEQHVIPFVITNIAWTLIAGIDILRHFLGRPRRKRGR